MSIFSWARNNFGWLKTSIKHFNFWVIVGFCVVTGWLIHSIIHQSELREIDLYREELLLKEERLEAQLGAIEKSKVVLNSGQLKILAYIYDYQNKTGLPKLIISRDGFIFDEKKGQDTTINVISEVMCLDQNKEGVRKEFENILLSIPEKLLRIIPEVRWGSPFVVSITDEGIKYLLEHKPSNK